MLVPRNSWAIAMAATLLLIVGCASDGGGSDDLADPRDPALPREQVRVKVGETPPSPEAVGLAWFVEPAIEPWAGTFSVTLDEFASKWNEMVIEENARELILEEVTVGYSAPRGLIVSDVNDWVRISGSYDYDTENLIYIGLNWNVGSGSQTAVVEAGLRGLLAGLEVDSEVHNEILYGLGIVGDDFANSQGALERIVEAGDIEVEIVADESLGEVYASVKGSADAFS